jgi:hypothetical protein
MNLVVIPEEIIELILCYCQHVAILTMTGVSQSWRMRAQRLLQGAYGIDTEIATQSHIQLSIARRWFSVSTCGRSVALHAPSAWGCIVTVLDHGIIRWPECYGTVFSGIRTDHRMLPKHEMTDLCLLGGSILVSCTDGGLMVWKKQTTISALHRVPMHDSRQGSVDVRIIAICRDDRQIDQAFALADTGDLWAVCADIDSRNFGGTAVAGALDIVNAVSIECIQGCVLLHDKQGKLWHYNANWGTPYLIQLTPFGHGPHLIGCMVSKSHAVVGRQMCRPADLRLVGTSSVQQLILHESVPPSMIIQMCFCPRVQCILVVLSNKLLLIVRVDQRTDIVSPAVMFSMPAGLGVLCVLSGVMIDTSGGIWCVDLENETSLSFVSSTVLRHIGEFRNGVISSHMKAAMTPTHRFI